MARTVRDTNLETRAKRRDLTPQRKPYWRTLDIGLHLGYRRNKDASGTWVARRFVGDGKYRETRLGLADDADKGEADALVILSFKQAQEAARAWWRAEERRDLGHAPEDTGPYTVNRALDEYFATREAAGSKGVAKDRSSAALRIRPDLGEVVIDKLTAKRIRDWHHDLAKSDKLARPKTSGKRKTAAIDQKDSDAVRARRSTANRTLTVLKAALNHAYHEGMVSSDEAWRKAKPFREVDAAVVHFLSEDECRRLVNACDGAFRNLVRAALLTGCRYGELTRMKARDLDAQARTVMVRESKAGTPRHVALTDEGTALFAAMTAGKTSTNLIFLRDDANPWAASHQQRPLEAACSRAKIEPAATFHILRHTYASALARKGVPMGVIAAQLGHADTRMTEKHYAHLAPNHVADTIRAALPSLGIVETSNVVDLVQAGKKKSGGNPAA